MSISTNMSKMYLASKYMSKCIYFEFFINILDR